MALELSVRDGRAGNPAVAERVRRVDSRRLGYLRPLFAEFCDDPADVEGRCLLVLTLFVGESSGERHPRSAYPTLGGRGRRPASAALRRSKGQGSEPAAELGDQTTLGEGAGDRVGDLPHLERGLTHRDTSAGPGQHLGVVASVTDGEHVARS